MDFVVEYLVPVAGALAFVCSGILYFVQKYRPKSNGNVVQKLLYLPVLIDPDSFSSLLDYNRAKRKIILVIAVVLGLTLCLSWYIHIGQLSRIFDTTVRQAVIFVLGPLLLLHLAGVYFSIDVSDDSDYSN